MANRTLIRTGACPVDAYSQRRDLAMEAGLADAGRVNVDVLVIPDCPHRAAAEAFVRSALDDLGLRSVPVRVTVVETQEDAERLRLAGSPTILVDGWDPFAPPGAEPTLACRIYRDGDALPDARELRQALKRVAAEKNATPGLATCWCCGHQRADTEVVHLGNHPEVVVCLPCAHFLHQQARSREDAARPSLGARGRDALRAGRREVMRRDWHRKPIIGPALRWLGPRLP
jgi:hypothetical protein